MPSTFSLQEVVGGVWAAVAPGTSGPAVSNASIIDLGDKSVVVDTFMTVRAAEELATEARRLTGRTPFLVINSHWHSDHVRGNRIFRDTAIVGTERMAELMMEDSPATPEEFRRKAEAVHQLARDLTAGAEVEDERRRAEGTMALATALLEEADEYRLTLPSVLIGDRLDLAGERPATVLSYGRGHTESDIFVHLPEDDVVIAGDLVWTGIHPKMNDGFPEDWAGVLDKITALAPRHVVPGHGEPGGAGDVAAMAAYVRGFAALLEAVKDGAVSPQDAAVPTGFDSWADESRFRSGLTALGRS